MAPCRNPQRPRVDLDLDNFDRYAPKAMEMGVSVNWLINQVLRQNPPLEIIVRDKGTEPTRIASADNSKQLLIKRRQLWRIEL